MWWRLKARFLTGPFAFLLGGVIDLLAFAYTALRARVAQSGASPSTIAPREDQRREDQRLA